MKRKICPSLTLGLLASATCLMGADLTIGSQSVIPGASLTVPVTLLGGTGVTALQFDLTFNSGLFRVTPTLGATAESAGKSLASATLPNGNLRVLVAGLNQNALSDAVMVNLAIAVSADTQPGTYYIMLSETIAANADGDAVPLGAESGRIVVEGSPGNASAPLRFVPLAPCRVVDTRTGSGKTGLFGPPTLAGNTLRTVPVTQSDCGISQTARAYSTNITVLPRGPLGYLSVWPAGLPQPLVSTLNSADGRVVANAAIVPAGPGGSITLFVTDATDVLLDINGYFAP